MRICAKMIKNRDFTDCNVNLYRGFTLSDASGNLLTEKINNMAANIVYAHVLIRFLEAKFV